MTVGRCIAVVGPSGVGKDSVLTGLNAARSDLKLVQRVITRTPELGGEDYFAVTEDEFETHRQSGSFALHWDAHGLRYGIPISVLEQINNGQDCLINVSRSALVAGAKVFPNFMVLNVSARPKTIARRLAQRGRESPEAIAKRLDQANKPLPDGLNVIHLENDGPLPQTVNRAIVLLQPPRV